ncbi:hypothetical protein ACIB24_02060 [Spongisporangium articulatum]|uniref:Phosphopantetheinyl transferase n=1 Tax=Spongisporangium articulatum TaxID=3362603 RepID=A0ABW8AJM6_9ACTN
MGTMTASAVDARGLAGALAPAGSLLATRTEVVAVDGAKSLGDLLHGCPTGLVFSNAEQRLCGMRDDLTGWAGRLAAKLAVATLLDLEPVAALRERRDIGLAHLEVLPDRGDCPDGPGCLGPHPPALHLGSPAFAGVEGRWQLSISHTRSRAMALVARYSEGTVNLP